MTIENVESHLQSEEPAIRAILEGIYARLLAHYGPQDWWPTETGSRWEVMVGAVLTQHTTWTNVTLALANLVSALGREGLTDPLVIARLPDDILGAVVRPAGHFTSKPRRLKILADFVIREGGIEALRASEASTADLRARLLELWGIGPETADAILLYALDRPVFVADAYARRLGSRWGLLTPSASYFDVQSLFMDNLPHDVHLFNQYHALIVAHGKDICRPRPRCPTCPLNEPFPLSGVEHPPGEWCCPRLYTPYNS